MEREPDQSSVPVGKVDHDNARASLHDENIDALLKLQEILCFKRNTANEVLRRDEAFRVKCSTSLRAIVLLISGYLNF